MEPVNISTLAKWELVLVIGDRMITTFEPTLAALIAMKEAEDAMQGFQAQVRQGNAQALTSIEALMRESLAKFAPPSADAIATASYSDLEAAITTAGAYYQEWVQKKRIASEVAGLTSAGVPEATALERVQKKIECQTALATMASAHGK